MDMTSTIDPGGGVKIGSLRITKRKSKTLTAGNYRLSNLSIEEGGTLRIIGDVTLHLNGNLTMGQNARIILDSGKLLIYADGAGMYLDGGTLVNDSGDPGRLVIHGTSRMKTVRLNGKGIHYLLLRAPAANITMGGDMKLYGSVVGNSVDLAGGATVHYAGRYKDHCADDHEDQGKDHDDCHGDERDNGSRE